MITLTTALPGPLAANAQGAPSAIPSDAETAAPDFSFLLGLGVEQLSDPAAAAPAVGPETDGDEQAAIDPASILDAIAAAQSPADATPIAPGVPPAVHGSTAAAVDAGTESGGAGQRSKGLPARGTVMTVGGDEGKAPATADPRATAGKPEFLPLAARAAGIPEKGAAGELRAEMATRAVPESQALTHHLHAQAPHAARHSGPPPAQLQLPQQLATPAWNDGLADHAVWMARNDVQTAELHLHPADLGPIEVTLTLTGDDKSQATVQFSAAHAGTREAIETALPRLREMMQENGITLGQAGVDANTRQASPDEGRQAQSQGRPSHDGGATRSGTTVLPSPGTPRHGGNGLVDTFA